MATAWPSREYGHVVAQGAAHVAKLIDRIEDPGSDLPEAARLALAVLVDTLGSLDGRIGQLDHELARRAREDEDARRLQIALAPSGTLPPGWA